MPRAVLHLDLDAFYASVEQRDKPSLRGKPVVVGGLGWRGVVATASYEARVFDIGSAMPTALARRRAPHAAYLAPRFGAYRIASAQVMALVAELSDVVEPLSLDEAYVDLSSRPEASKGLTHLRPLVEDFRARVRAATGLTVSVGLAANKLLAKIASDAGKPDGLVVVEPGTQAEMLAPLGVRALPGVGAATSARLATLGIATVGQLARADEREVVSLLGKAAGSALVAAASGRDERPVVAEREAKSVSAEETFARDLTDRAQLADQIDVLAGRVAGRLGSASGVGAAVAARTVTLKVRRYDFATTGRSVTTGRPVVSAHDIAVAARSLLAGVDVADGVRLIGVGVCGFVDHVQEDLLAGLDGAPADVVPGDVVPADDGSDGASSGPPDGQPDGARADPTGRFPEQRWQAPWRPGQDVVHTRLGPGWVQGSGVGRVTVRFEGPHTGVGRVRTFALDDPDLAAADPPSWQPS